MPDAYPPTLDSDEHPKGDGREDHVQAEEGRNAVREKLLDKEPDIKAVVAKERNAPRTPATVEAIFNHGTLSRNDTSAAPMSDMFRGGIP